MCAREYMIINEMMLIPNYHINIDFLDEYHLVCKINTSSAGFFGLSSGAKFFIAADKNGRFCAFYDEHRGAGQWVTVVIRCDKKSILAACISGIGIVCPPPCEWQIGRRPAVQCIIRLADAHIDVLQFRFSVCKLRGFRPQVSRRYTAQLCRATRSVPPMHCSPINAYEICAIRVIDQNRCICVIYSPQITFRGPVHSKLYRFRMKSCQDMTFNPDASTRPEAYLTAASCMPAVKAFSKPLIGNPQHYRRIVWRYGV